MMEAAWCNLLTDCIFCDTLRSQNRPCRRGPARFAKRVLTPGLQSRIPRCGRTRGPVAGWRRPGAGGQRETSLRTHLLLSQAALESTPLSTLPAPSHSLGLPSPCEPERRLAVGEGGSRVRGRSAGGLRVRAGRHGRAGLVPALRACPDAEDGRPNRLAHLPRALLASSELARLLFAPAVSPQVESLPPARVPVESHHPGRPAGRPVRLLEGT